MKRGVWSKVAWSDNCVWDWSAQIGSVLGSSLDMQTICAFRLSFNCSFPTVQHTQQITATCPWSDAMFICQIHRKQLQFVQIKRHVQQIHYPKLLEEVEERNQLGFSMDNFFSILFKRG